jgi:hypothetical protein
VKSRSVVGLVRTIRKNDRTAGSLESPITILFSRTGGYVLYA